MLRLFGYVLYVAAQMQGWTAILLMPISILLSGILLQLKLKESVVGAITGGLITGCHTFVLALGAKYFFQCNPDTLVVIGVIRPIIGFKYARYLGAVPVEIVVFIALSAAFLW